MLVRAKKGGDFYIVSGCSKYSNVAHKMTEDFGVCCNFHYNTGDYFKTAQEAEKSYNNIIITQKLKDIALRLNNGIDIDWTNDKNIYELYLDCDKSELDQVNIDTFKSCNTIYCLHLNFSNGCKRILAKKN
jgi:hypothetical protein